MKSPPACRRRCWTSGELSAIRKVPARCLGRVGLEVGGEMVLSMTQALWGGSPLW